MRSTSILLGIKGIFPIIKKECPQAIYYPARYSSLKGYRIAIDATLLVQRFHFSEDEHPARHVIGFYRLISALRAEDVYPIFVFDHLQSRLSAKSRETEKRREARGRVRERMKLEMRRAWRLRMLSEGLKRILTLHDGEKVEVGKLLRSWAAERREKKEVDVAVEEVAEPDALRDWSAFQLRLDELAETSTSRVQGAIQEEEEDSSAMRPPPPSPLDHEDSSEQEAELVWQTIHEDQTSSAHAIALQIDSLRRDFRQHHSRPVVGDVQADKVEGLSHGHEPTTSPPSAPTPSFTGTPQTATQLKMNDVEEQLYSSLMDGLGLEPQVVTAQTNDAAWKVVQEKMDNSIRDAASEVAETSEKGSTSSRIDVDQSAFESITSRNELLQRSYRRSSAPLASTIFDDCATLCTLLKAPVLWTGSGSPHGGAKGEAEALAASLVSNGYADAVATEDSDVLLAEVPLLRHFTGTKKPMELIDSLAVRRALFPVKGNEDRADKLSRYSMLELALLCGTDFNRTIPGLAGKGALRLLREYGTIRGILRSYPLAGKKYRPPDGLTWKEYGAELTRARTVFKSPPDAKGALRLNGLRTWDGSERGSDKERRRRVVKKRRGKGETVETDTNSVEGVELGVGDQLATSGAELLGEQADSATATFTSEELTLEQTRPAAESVELIPADKSNEAPNSPAPLPTSLQAMEDAIPSEDNSTTLVEAESGPDSDLLSRRLPPPPSISLLDSLSSPSPSSPLPRSFPIPEYDRFAVRSFLRSKGLGKGREATMTVMETRESWREREIAWQSGLRSFDDDDDDPSDVGATSQHGQHASLGFGQSTFGDSSTAAMRFEWDEEQKEEQR